MRIVLSLAVGLCLAGCATDNQSRQYTGGYNQTQLSQNVFQVSFEWAGYSNTDADEILMLRSAELALSNDFKYFGFSDSNFSIVHSIYTAPQYLDGVAQASVYGSGIPYVINSSTYDDSSNLKSVDKTTRLVIMFHNKPDHNALIYGAAFICQSLASKYKVNCSYSQR